MNNLAINSITPYTLEAYSGIPSAIVWFSTCNLNCQICDNPNLLKKKGIMKISEVIAYLKTQKEKLKGIVLSGGEATISRQVIMLCNGIKELGFLVKLETNGTNPKVLQYLIDKKLINYVSLDFKSNQENYVKITGSKKSFYVNTLKSFKLLNRSKIDFEIKTTLHGELLHNKELLEIIKLFEKLKYQGHYYIHALDGVHVKLDKEELIAEGKKHNIIVGFKNI